MYLSGKGSYVLSRADQALHVLEVHNLTEILRNFRFLEFFGVFGDELFQFAFESFRDDTEFVRQTGRHQGRKRLSFADRLLDLKKKLTWGSKSEDYLILLRLWDVTDELSIFFDLVLLLQGFQVVIQEVKLGQKSNAQNIDAVFSVVELENGTVAVSNCAVVGDDHAFQVLNDTSLEVSTKVLTSVLSGKIKKQGKKNGKKKEATTQKPFQSLPACTRRPVRSPLYPAVSGPAGVEPATLSVASERGSDYATLTGG